MEGLRETIKKLGRDMIWEGVWSEFHQKQGNSYMYGYHHERYIRMQRELDTARNQLTQ